MKESIMKIIPILVGGTALWLTACGEKPDTGAKSESPAPASDASSQAKPDPAFAAPDTFQAALGKVFEGYVGMQGALARDDLSQAKEVFNSMHAVLHMMPTDGLTPDAKAYWDSADARIMESLHPLASEESLDSARVHFADFSAVMADLIAKFGIAGDQPIYQFHCPMARENQGSLWLQKDKEVANPYFGKSMLKCGNLVRTLDG
jgi:Cu(I)/Ag(I) efflux system membrane fusion protein